MAPELREQIEAAEKGPLVALRAWCLMAKHMRKALTDWARAPLSDESGERSHARRRAVDGMMEMFEQFLLECAVRFPDSLHLESRVHAARSAWDAIDRGLPEVVMAHLDRIADRDLPLVLRGVHIQPDPEVLAERLFGEGALHAQLGKITREDWEEMGERWLPAPWLPLPDGVPGPPRDYGQAKVVFPILAKRGLVGNVSERRATPTKLARPGGKKQAEADLAEASRTMMNAARKARAAARKRVSG